jgi:hypothetical protein
VEKYVKAILPRERRVLLNDPESREKSSVYLYSARPKGPDLNGTSFVKAVAAVCVPPMTEIRIQIRADRQVLSVIRPVQDAEIQCLLRMDLLKF